MSNKKNNLPENIKIECGKAIHIASGAAAAAAAVPIPVADAIPITAAQIAMIIALGNVFDVTISDSVAKAVVGCGLAQNIGRTVAAAILKSIPIINVATIAVNSSVAAAVTEALGWIVADNFYRMSLGEEPDNSFDKAGEVKKQLKQLFTSNSKNKK